MLKLGFDGMTGFSSFPMRISAFIGLIVIGMSLFMFGYMVFDNIFHNVPYMLYKWLIVIIFGFVGVLFILVWLLGEYIWRIFDEQKLRPIFIIDQDNHND